MLDRFGGFNKIKIQYEFLKRNPDFVLSFHDGYIANGLNLTKKMILNSSTKKDLNFNNLITVGYTIPTLTVFFRNVIIEDLYHYGGIWSMKNKLYQSIESYKTYKLTYQFFKDKRIYYLLNNFATSIIIYSIKNKKYWLAIKYYFKNILNILVYPTILKIFLKKHVVYISKFLHLR